MATNLGQMSDEKFRELTKEDYWISNIKYAVQCCDGNGKLKHYKTVTYPYEYIVTGEQIEKAKEMWSRRRAEVLADIKKGELVFCAMGMDYQSTHEGGVNNHRIRCNFRNKEGHRYFIELLQTENYWNGEKIEKGDWLYVDFSVDLDKADENERLRKELWERRKQEQRRLPDIPQTEYNAKGVEKKSFRIPFTWQNVLNFVNKTYGCDYTSARLLKYFVDCDDWECEC